MLKLLNLKIFFISALFGAFGFVLLKMVDIKNLPTFITGVGMLFSLILSFICSTLLLSRLTVAKRKLLIIIATVIFVVSLVLYFLLQKKIDTLTLDLQEFSGDSIVTNRYFKGTALTPLAQDYKENNPAVTDEEIVLMFENNIYNVWTTQSIKSVMRETTLVYYLFIFTIVFSISILVEILSKKRKINKIKMLPVD